MSPGLRHLWQLMHKSHAMGPMQLMLSTKQPPWGVALSCLSPHTQKPPPPPTLSCHSLDQHELHPTVLIQKIWILAGVRVDGVLCRHHQWY